MSDPADANAASCEARADLIRPIIMRGFRERISANDVTDMIVAALTDTAPTDSPIPDGVRDGWQRLVVALNEIKGGMTASVEDAACALATLFDRHAP